MHPSKIFSIASYLLICLVGVAECLLLWRKEYVAFLCLGVVRWYMFAIVALANSRPLCCQADYKSKRVDNAILITNFLLSIVDNLLLAFVMDDIAPNTKSLMYVVSVIGYGVFIVAATAFGVNEYVYKRKIKSKQSKDNSTSSQATTADDATSG